MKATMDEDLDQVLALKASAKSARDDNEWEEAISDLNEAIKLLRTRMEESPSPPTWLASEFADVYGLIGGVERRWGLSLADQERQRHLQASVAAYDQGFDYEQDLPPSDANTYNRVNRLVGRVLLNSLVLNEEGSAAPEIADELRRAEEIVTQEIRSSRQKDPWAYCDLGIIQLLLGETNALFTFQELDRLRPPEFVYDSMLATLEPLSEVASDLRPDLMQAVVNLQRSAKRSR
jgi:hypothetical protein